MKIKLSHLIYIISIIFISTSSFAQEIEVNSKNDASVLDFKRSDPSDNDPNYDRRMDNKQYLLKVYENLHKAVEVHNFASRIFDSMTLAEMYKKMIADHVHAVSVQAANEACNISLLTPYYYDPQDVWKKISTWAYELEKAGASEVEKLQQEVVDAMISQLDNSNTNYNRDYNPAVANMAPEDSSQQTGTDLVKSVIKRVTKAILPGGESLSDAVNDYNSLGGSNPLPIEQFSGNIAGVTRGTWDIGNKVLVDVYANQSKWGKKKQPFPLWGDQQYLYDSEWNRRYGDIKQALVNENTECTSSKDSDDVCTIEPWVLLVPDRGPSVSDTYKYDHEDYDPKTGTQAILKAHNNYLRLIKTKPKGVNLSVMHSPPKPLPPLKEAVHVYIWKPSSSFEQNFGMFPGLPAVWKQFVDSNYVFFNLGKEDHYYYHPESNNNYYYVDESGNKVDPSQSTSMFNNYKKVPILPVYKTYAMEMAPFLDYSTASQTYSSGKDEPSVTLPANNTYPRISGAEFKIENDSMVHNRIETYLIARLNEEDLRPLKENAERDIVKLHDDLREDIAKYDIILKESFDVTNPTDYNAAIAELRAKQEEYIAKAREVFDQLVPDENFFFPEDMEKYVLYEKVFDAFNLDKEMVARIDYSDIDRFPETILQANADIAAGLKTIATFKEPIDFPTVGCPIY